jgi:hypothetical protein
LPHSTLEALAAGAYELLKPICGSLAYLHILNRKTLPLRHPAFIIPDDATIDCKSDVPPEKGNVSDIEQVIVIFSGFCKTLFRGMMAAT